MKIAAVTATPLRIPLTQFFYNSENAGTKREWGGRLSRVSPPRPSPILEYLLVRIATDAGATGIGEAQADIGFSTRQSKRSGPPSRITWGPSL